MTLRLRDLREDPFRLLSEMDRHLRALRTEVGGHGGDLWQGLAFRQGERWMVAPRDDVREVIAPPRVTRVPNARPWLSGVANVRGSLLTLVDLGVFLGGTTTVPGRSARVLVLNSDRVPAGFLVDEVAGYRQFTTAEQVSGDVAPDDAAAPYVLGGFLREGRPWRVLSLHRMAQSEAMRRAGW